MHHFNGTELRCAPSVCIVHHRRALCIMAHNGDILGGIFHFFGGSYTLVVHMTFFMYVISYHLNGAQCDVVSRDGEIDLVK